jgi:hypothetical protein
MPSTVHDSVSHAAYYRYSADKQGDGPQRANADTLSAYKYFSESGIQISHDLTPVLAENIDTVCKRLMIPRAAVSAFVWASADLQAQCFSPGSDKFAVRMTSAIVDHMTNEELNFVIGHEFGHFLYGHSNSAGTGDDSVENYILQRAHEISADRIGLLACSSLEVAIKALMKTSSGLTDRHLRFDVSAFIDQMRRWKGAHTHMNTFATHPSMVARSRALLWFSMADMDGVSSGEAVALKELKEIDGRISGDLRKYVDQAAFRQIEEAKSDFQMWIAVYIISRDGKVEKHEQNRFEDQFGAALLGKFLTMGEGMPAQEVRDRIAQNLLQADNLYRSTAPQEYQNSSLELIKATCNSYGYADLEEELRHLIVH